MNIAELFVKLGIKGEGSSGKALKNIDKGLGDIKSSGIATKAAILGVVYGLERMMSNSAQAGTGLKQFSDATGLSTKTLQTWQHAGRKFSVSEEEITGAFSGIQKSMMDMIATGNQPSGMSVFANAMKIDPKRLKDTEYMMQKLQEYMQMADPSEARLIGGSFGFSDAMIGSMRKGAFSANAIAKAQKEANIYSKGEIDNLQNIESKWAQIGHNIKMAVGRLVADQGLEFVKPIEKAAASMVVFTGKLLDFLKHTKALEKVATIFENIGHIMDHVSGVKDIFKMVSDREEMKKSNKERLKGSQASIDRMKHQKKKGGAWDFRTGVELNRAQAAQNDPRRGDTTNTTSVTINESDTPRETGKEVVKQLQASHRMKDNGQES